MLVTFRPFSAMHVGVLLLFAAATALFVWAGRRSDAVRRTRIERALGSVMLGAWAVSTFWWMWPSRFDAASSLPLQVCDITSLLAALVLITPHVRATVLLYFWGIGMSLQALITPDLNRQPDSIWFWLFWMTHAGTLGITLYLVIVRGYRPTWRDYGFALAAGFGYLVVVFTVDVLFGFNYGYVGDSKPGQPSVIDFLGPWPGRVAVVAILVALLMAVLVLPWQFGRRPVPERLSSR